MMDYDKLISKRCAPIKPSGIRKFFDIAGQIEDVISLGVGEPDFQTPWSVRKTAITALEKGKTIYTANSGLIELRKEISKYLEKTQRVKYDPTHEIIVTVGGSEAIDLGIRAMVDPGDEVLVVEPSFVCYAPIVELTGGIAVPIETKAEDNFKLTAEALKAKITDKTKLLILPFPNNPTGAVMTRSDLEKIAEVLRDTNIVVLSDEIYSELTYTGEPHCSIVSFEGMQERTLVINGFSKGFAMTGWRLGYICGPSVIIEQMLKIHQFAIMCAPTNSQYAAIEGLRHCEDEVQQMRNAYNQRRRYLVNEFAKMKLECFEPFGAFYIFPSIKEFGMTSEEFAMRFLEEEKVAVVPGSAFGESGEGFLRVSYAYSLEDLKEAIGRLSRFVERLRSQK